MQQDAVTLSQLSTYIRNLISEADIRVWIVAEIHSISVNRHCYIECVEKSEITGDIVARLKFNIWANVAREILMKFRAETGHELAVGMKIMVYATVSYHELYGMSGTITAINPDYTLGDLEKQRRATIQKLEEDGVIDMNKQLELPTAIQDVAVISSETAAGYGDFCDQLLNNQYGLKYNVKLYSALVQGREAPQSIISALESIAAEDELPDVVVIIRGGGSRADLLCFDDYDLVSNIAQFPVPVVTGIGHDRDTSVADIVAHTQMKTPTAVAGFLVDHNAVLLASIEQLNQQVLDLSVGRVDANMQRLEQLASYLNMASQTMINRLALDLDKLHFELKQISANAIIREQQRVERLSEVLLALDPSNLLKKGYTLTSADGHRVKKASDARSGAKLVTLTSDGKIVSVVQ